MDLNCFGLSSSFDYWSKYFNSIINYKLLFKLERPYSLLVELRTFYPFPIIFLNSIIKILEEPWGLRSLQFLRKMRGLTLSRLSPSNNYFTTIDVVILKQYFKF